MRRLLCALAMAALTAGTASNASAYDGWYGRADLGLSDEGEADVAVFDGEETTPASVDLEDDWMGDVGAGYAFGNGLRAEGELAYRTNEFTAPAVGEVDAWSLMLNGFYDFNRGGSIQPYLGAGAGYARVEPDAADNDSAFAWQVLFGVGVPLSERLTLDAGYRFFRVEDLDFTGVDADYDHQAVTFGLRFQLGAAAAAAPVAEVVTPAPEPVQPTPPPVACPKSEFVVYFEWDRSNLNQAALETIDAAVNRARQCNVGDVLVVGHTDTSGATQYNAGLSERRAAVVGDALVARGLAAGSIRTEARGESDLATATRDGVREPLNRRTGVTISFR